MTWESLGQRAALVVEDDEDFIEILRRLIEAEGLGIDFARDGQTALDLLSRRDYALMTIDLQIPGPDGLAIIEQIRLASPEKLARVVVFTGFQSIAHSFEPEVTTISKPNLLTLRSEIRRILGEA